MKNKSPLGSLLKKAHYCFEHQTLSGKNKISLSSWKTYVGWVEQIKARSGKEKATELTMADIRAFLASLHRHHKGTYRNARQGIVAVFLHVFWTSMPSEFQQAFLLELKNPLKSKHRGGWKKTGFVRVSPDVPIPSPQEFELWLSLLPEGKPQRACLRVYASGIPSRQAAAKHRTSIPMMTRVLRIGRQRARSCGVEIPIGAGLRTLRTGNILKRIRAGEDPSQIIRAVGLRNLSALKPYLRLAGLA